MFTEKDPPNPMLTENLYRTFEGFLISSKYIPTEFQGLPEVGTQASEDMLRELVNRIKDSDPDNFKSRIRILVDKNSKTLPSHFLEDINYFLKYGTFGSK